MHRIYDYQTTTTDKMTYFPEKVTIKTPILSEYDQYAVKINPKETVQITNEEGKCIEDLEGVSKGDNFDNPNSLMYYVPEGTYHVAASDKKDDSIQSDMKLDNKTDTVKVSTYDKHENETKKVSKL